MTTTANDADHTRRALIAGGVALVALAAVPRALARLPLLAEDEPDAVALSFVTDAARLDPAAQPLFKPGSRCTSCFFYQGGRSSDSAPCTVFAGWRVPASGWCREFTPRP
jgi:hypothetical protein